VRLPPDLELLRMRDFRLVFSASLVSLIGDGIVPVALSFAVLDRTHSASDLGIVLASGGIALVLSLLLGGVVADRVSRRGVMVAADLVRLASQGAIGILLVSGHATLAELAVSQAFVGAATGFFNPASSGLLPAVAGPHLRQANALRGMSSAVGNIAGPAIAGVLVVATSPGVALLVDAGTYGLSALALSRVARGVGRAQREPAPSTPRRFVRELRDGFAEVRSRTWLWSSLLVFSLLNMVAAAFPVLGAFVAKQHLGGAGAWAAILAARALGGLIGGTALLRFSPRRPLLAAVIACASAPVPSLLLAIPAPLALLIGVTLVSGFGPLVFNALWETTLQQHVPEHARSRVSSYDWFASFALAPVGLALVGPLASAIGTSAALYACGASELALLATLLLVREVRTLAPAPAPAAGAAEG
jgi:MFS family permease